MQSEKKKLSKWISGFKVVFHMAVGVSKSELNVLFAVVVHDVQHFVYRGGCFEVLRLS